MWKISIPVFKEMGERQPKVLNTWIHAPMIRSNKLVTTNQKEWIKLFYIDGEINNFLLITEYYT